MDEAEENLKSLRARFNQRYIRELSAGLNAVNPIGLTAEQIERVKREHNLLNKSDAVRYIRTKNREQHNIYYIIFNIESKNELYNLY